MGLFSPKISIKKLVPLCRQLSTANDAGIPLVRTLELVGTQFNDARVRDLMAQMRDDIKAGATLADAASAQSKYLPRFFVELLAAGEQGGRLNVMMQDLAQYYEDMLDMKRRVVRMLAYPVFLVVAAWFLGTFALRLVGPIAGFAQTSQGEPFDLEGYFRGYLTFQGYAMAVFAALFAGCVLLSRMGLLRWIWGAVATHLWPLSAVTRRIGLARFFRSMSLLIGSGVYLPDCIKRSAAVTANPYLERDLLKAVGPVSNGTTLTEAFADIGSGKLESALCKVADYHMEEAAHAIAIAMRAARVLIVLGIGALVGYIVIRFYAGLYGGLLNGIG